MRSGKYLACLNFLLYCRHASSFLQQKEGLLQRKMSAVFGIAGWTWKSLIGLNTGRNHVCMSGHQTNTQLTVDSDTWGTHLNCLRVCRVYNHCNAGGSVNYKIAVVVWQHRDGNYFDTCGQTNNDNVTFFIWIGKGFKMFFVTQYKCNHVKYWLGGSIMAPFYNSKMYIKGYRKYNKII